MFYHIFARNANKTMQAGFSLLKKGNKQEVCREKCSNDII
jgi:hypothetical protein